ncbi:hypothetical protein LCGC14_1680060, partial [marine sediment metagenome]
AKFRWLDFKITNRCNNNCVYYGVKNDSPSAFEKIPFGSIKKTLIDAIDSEFNYFCFLGGEPSIRKDIVDIINVVGNKPDLHLRLITNLKVFNESMYHALFSTLSNDAELVSSFENLSYPNYKCVNPQNSLAYINMINNLARKYQEKFNNKRRRTISLHSVISRENYFKIGRFVDYFFKKEIDISLGLVCPSIITEHPENFNEFTREELQVIIDQLDELETHNKLNFANSVLRDFLLMYKVGEFSHRYNCWAGKKQVIINSDGEVFPCISESYLSTKRYGNINNERFKDILKKFDNFKCSMAPNSACWDHYMWDRLGKKIEKGENL